jgi:tRNA (mo5U34)-methyltransferase
LNVPTPERAAELAARTDFAWHQRFELAAGVYAPGVSDVAFLLDAAGIGECIEGATVLDIGTTNGGAAFACERRGAKRVIAVDIVDDKWFGFAAIKDALDSQAEHLQASIYELPELLSEQFDVVMFWGVLYHLRHPLLALDNVRRLARGTVTIETAVCDHELTLQRDLPLARFYRTDELGADSSNWFAPSVAGLMDWCRSCGLEPTHVHAWPDGAPSRAMVAASSTAGDPEYLTLSYERPLNCSVVRPGLGSG